MAREIAVHVTEHNHEWAAAMTGMTVSDVDKEFAKAQATGYVCVIRTQVKDTGVLELKDHPLGHTAFISSDDRVINFGGENYYRACPEMVSQHQGCVKRVGHVTEHEDFYGNKKAV